LSCVSIKIVHIVNISQIIDKLLTGVVVEGEGLIPEGGLMFKSPAVTIFAKVLAPEAGG
jgi:hypothetical protein